MVAWLVGTWTGFYLGKGSLYRGNCLFGFVFVLDVPTPSQSGLQALESHFCEEHSDFLPLRIH